MAKKTQSIATSPPQNGLANTQPKSSLATVKALFARQEKQFTAALGGQMGTARFMRTALTAFSRGDERFQSADPISLLGACMKAAELGLSVDPLLQEFHLIPRRNKKRGGVMWIEGQMGYKGLIKLAKRNPDLRNVKPELVHEGDFFEYELGSKPFIRHRFDESPGTRPELRLAYATVYYRDGSSCSHVSPLYEILESRGRSDAYKRGYGPWLEFFTSMAKIVPLRALMRLESVDSVVLEQLEREQRSDRGEVVELDLEALGVTGEEMPAIAEAPGDVEELKNQFAVGKGEAG